MRTRASAIGAANISDFTSHAYLSVSVKCLQTPRFSSGKTLSSNHNTGNFLRQSINITANQRLSPTFQGNQNKGHDTDVSLPDFFFREGAAVHRLQVVGFFPFCITGAKLTVNIWPSQLMSCQ